jgi:type II secretory pathway pseudopilin PulG
VDVTDDATNVTRPTRATVLLAFVVVGVLLILAIVALLWFILTNHRADEERECRSRIVAHAEEIRDAQGTAVANGLASSVIERGQVDARAIARDIRDLGERLVVATELRGRADEVCATNPDFTPPP